MRVRLFFMIAGTALLAFGAWWGWDALRDPQTLMRIELHSLSAFVGWAFLLTSAILPIVCVVSILRGWLAHVSGPRAMALRRLLTVPLIVGAVNALLFAIAAFTSDGF